MSESTILEGQARWWCYGIVLAAAVSFLFTLGLPHMGEEGVYTISTLEMWFNTDKWLPTLYGTVYHRPPMINWLSLPLIQLLGYEHVLVATRLVTALSTLGTGALLFYFTQQVFKQSSFAWLVIAVFFSGDLLYKRGWLAYADPLFAFFVFLSFMAIWLSVTKREQYWMPVAALGLIGAFLTKALTGYVIYGTTILTLFYDKNNRSFFFKPNVLFWHVVALSFPLFWSLGISQGEQGGDMLVDIFNKWSDLNFKTILNNIVLYPVDTLARFLPTSLLACWVLLNKKQETEQSEHFKSWLLISLIALINYIPYWLAPMTRPRYILPLYPLISLSLTYIIVAYKPKLVKPLLMMLGVFLIIKYIAVLGGHEKYLLKKEGNTIEIAKTIQAVVGNANLYTEADTAPGLSISAAIDILRYPNTPIMRVPSDFSEGYVLSNIEHAHYGDIVTTYDVGRYQVFLYKK